MRGRVNHPRMMVAIALFALCGCRSASTRIYPLTQTEPVVRITASASILRVDTVHVPPDWDRIEILSPTVAGGLKINDLDRWAAPLTQLTRQLLSADLASRLPANTVIFPDLPKSSEALGIKVDILEFAIAHSQGILQVSWVISPARHPDAAKRSAETFSSAMAGTDPAAVVRAWSALIGQLADRVAADAASFTGS